MSRLHAVMADLVDVAAHFEVFPVPDVAKPGEVIEGARGLIVRESHGRRVLQSVEWGFPRHTKDMIARGDPPGRIGLVADLTNPMWSPIVVDPRYRCLIVLTHFGNPDGAPGEKTRTWYGVGGQPVIGWAGFCRNIPEVGPVYAGMTMAANAAVLDTNDRMPVILEPDDYATWFRGSIQDVIRFQFRGPIGAERMVVLKTDVLWRSGSLPNMQTQLALI